jgi:cupin fold WbuC family metalloprotein
MAAGFRMFNEEVLYATDRPILVQGEDIDELRRRAAANPRRRIRLCMHDSPASDIHEMLIFHGRDAYVPPHRHRRNGESLLVLEGSADAFFFDNDGAIIRHVPLGTIDSGRSFYYRLEPDLFHSLVIESEWFVFAETTQGPFDPSRSELAGWAPRADDENAVAQFMASLRTQCDRYGTRSGDVVRS